MTDIQLLCVHHHGHGGGDALVAAAGDDDDRHLAAAHAGVGPGGGHVPGPDLHILAVVLLQHPANAGPPGVFHALPGDGAVVVDLPLDHFPDVLHVHCVREIHDGVHIQAAPVRQSAGRAAGGYHRAAFQQCLPVFLNEDDVGVVVRNAQPDLVLPRPEGQHNVKYHVSSDGSHRNLVSGQIVPYGGLLLLRDEGDHFQNFPRVPGHSPRGGSGLDALQPAGVGHHHALYIFNDIPTGLHQHPLRHPAQHLPGLGRAVGNGDGLRTAHGGHQLLPEDLDEMAVAGIGLFHGGSPLFLAKSPNRSVASAGIFVKMR